MLRFFTRLDQKKIALKQKIDHTVSMRCTYRQAEVVATRLISQVKIPSFCRSTLVNVAIATNPEIEQTIFPSRCSGKLPKIHCESFAKYVQ